MHSDTVVWIAREFMQSSCSSAVHVRVATTTQEADDRRDDALLAERHPVLAVEAAHRDCLGHVVTQQLVRLTVIIITHYFCCRHYNDRQTDRPTQADCVPAVGGP